MKKLVISLALVIAVILPAMVSAQTAIDKLYERYAGEEGFTSINISPDMFNMLSDMDMGDSSGEVKEAQNVMHQLKGLKMLVYEPESGEISDFVKEVKDMIPSSEYSELMSVDSDDSMVKFLVKKNKNGNVSELLMLVYEEDEAVIMSMTGDIDMKTISEIGRSLNMDGLENLEDLEDLGEH
jgi:hypothetical protein